MKDPGNSDLPLFSRISAPLPQCTLVKTPFQKPVADIHYRTVLRTLQKTSKNN